jgi:hypothetical protein
MGPQQPQQWVQAWVTLLMRLSQNPTTSPRLILSLLNNGDIYGLRCSPSSSLLLLVMWTSFASAAGHSTLIASHSPYLVAPVQCIHLWPQMPHGLPTSPTFADLLHCLGSKS